MLLNQILDAKSAERVKSVLDKFKINMLALKTVLEMFSVNFGKNTINRGKL